MAIANPPLSGLPGSSNGALSIAELRSAAARDPKAAIRETAKQFEALFMQQLMKSMREATLSSGLLENSGTQLGTEMLDSQLANRMTGLPGGLGDMIARQLERQMTGVVAPGAIPVGGSVGAAASGGMAVDAPLSQRQTDFLRTHADAARQAEAASGIPAAFMVGQAAHESAWGQREIANADGSASHNLFGIKAGPGWSGPVAEVTTTEWIGGEPQKVTAKFRAYASYAESFHDYARLIKESPRYAAVMASVSNGTTSPQAFASGLQRAGYATDPLYADKLSGAIATVQRLRGSHA